jgi:hypothetical protein
MSTARATRMTGTEEDIVWELIANCASAYARFGRAVTLTDDDLAEAEGRKISAADRAEHAAADAAEREAFNALLAFPARRQMAMRTKARYIQMRIALGNRLQEDEVALLLSSMTEHSGAASAGGAP